MTTPEVVAAEPTPEELRDAILGLDPDLPEEVRERRRQPKEYMYFRLCKGCKVHTQGYSKITMGPANGIITAQEHAEFIANKHATPLPEYGKYDLDLVRDPGTRFKPIIEKGGIKEFSLFQMQELGWHRIPQVVALVPELGETEEIICTYGCATTGVKTRWFLVFDGVSESYNRHITGLHSEVAAPEAIGRKVSEAVVAAAQLKSMDIPELVAAVVLAIKQVENTKTSDTEVVVVPDIEEEDVPVAVTVNKEDAATTLAESLSKETE